MDDALDAYIKDLTAAKMLGKSLFWDEQSGGDGRVACATCHFAIGADRRSTNTINPGPDGVFSVALPGGTIDPSDFPLTSDDIVGSQGVVRHDFNGILAGSPVDDGTPVVDATFGSERRVTGRNTPTNIMSVLNDENFWDGRARNVFNGVHPGGEDATAIVFRANGSGVDAVNTEIEDSSSASQSVGPPNNEVEMSFGDGATNRSWSELGRKLLSMDPLALQTVDTTDSHLGAIADDGSGGGDSLGLTMSYEELIMASFNDEWWDSDVLFDKSRTVVGSGAPGADTYTLMETNFALFWGISQQMYESDLIPNDTAFDRGEMSGAAMLGFQLFEGEARCDRCHRAPEFTNAAFTNGGGGHMFANTGVRPVADDAGVGDGEFKSSTLRNTELTGPYFHNGGKLTLRQVVDFYDAGGDHSSDDTDSAIKPIGLSDGEKDALVSFMLALTDDRLRIGAAPFDHPSLDPPNGDPVDATGAAGGAATGTFLGVSPFDVGGAPLTMLRTNTTTVSGTAGGKQVLSLKDPANAGAQFVLLTRFGNGTTRVTSVGTLDSHGLATSEVALPAEPLAGLNGVVAWHAFVVLDDDWSILSISNSVPVELVP